MSSPSFPRCKRDPQMPKIRPPLSQEQYDYLRDAVITERHQMRYGEFRDLVTKLVYVLVGVASTLVAVTVERIFWRKGNRR